MTVAPGFALGEGEMTGDAPALLRLAEQGGEWQRPITVQAAAPFRLCFRLEEPEEPSKVESALGAANTTSPSTHKGAMERRYLLQARMTEPDRFCASLECQGAIGNVPEARNFHAARVPTFSSGPGVEARATRRAQPQSRNAWRL